MSKMTQLLALLLTSTLTVYGSTAIAADQPKDTAAAKTAKAALERPASVTSEAWNKMTDAEKAKAVEAAKTDKPKKEKKGGC